MKRLSGFSLMEMMIVLTIVAIVAAASAPMVNRKMVKSATEQQSLWSLINNGPSIGFNFNQNDSAFDNTTVNIGGVAPAGAGHPKLYINNDNSDATPHVAFGLSNSSFLKLTAGDTNGNIAFTDQTFTNASKSLAIGYGTEVNADKTIAIGYNTRAKGNNAIAIGVGTGESTNDKTLALGESSIAIGNTAYACRTESIAIGHNAQVSPNNAGGSNSIVIGANSNTNQNNTIVIGNNSRSTAGDCIVIGNNATSSENGIAIGSSSSSSKTTSAANYGIAVGGGANGSGISIGTDSASSEQTSVAIGVGSTATGIGAMAFGHKATASGVRSVAIGADATTTIDRQIKIGVADNTVVIPGNLVVEGTTFLGASKTTGKTFVRSNQNSTNVYGIGNASSGQLRALETGVSYITIDGVTYSDRRLKNVGESFKAGLAEIKKLEVFNYTFKDDKDKTPRVGVMAQDLKKIFPKAVTKGENGFLMIRMEDMFYAVINAVKELDGMLNCHSKRIEELEKQNKELQNTIDSLEKRLHALEKNKA